jgi:hypothetical protein
MALTPYWKVTTQYLIWWFVPEIKADYTRRNITYLIYSILKLHSS